MDEDTIRSYDLNYQAVSDLHLSLEPHDTYRLIDEHFTKSEQTIDIGCGTGRDCFWLEKRGFPVYGLDASHGMLEFAKKKYPNIDFILDTLPEISSIQDKAFTNILCSAVIMHLPENQLKTVALNLARIANDNATIIISFRGTQSKDQRESGKLYTPIDHEDLSLCFESAGVKLAHYQTELEAGRGHQWKYMVFRK